MFDAAASAQIHLPTSPQRHFSLWWINQINHCALHWQLTTGIVITLGDDNDDDTTIDTTNNSNIGNNTDITTTDIITVPSTGSWYFLLKYLVKKHMA